MAKPVIHLDTRFHLPVSSGGLHIVIKPVYNKKFSHDLHLVIMLSAGTIALQKLHIFSNTGYTQKNGAVSKVNKKFISHHTRAQRTQPAAATVQVSHALPAFRFSCLLRGRGARFQDGVAEGKGFLCAPF